MDLFLKLEGNDGEDVDVYLKPGANKNADVYIVHQMKIRMEFGHLMRIKLCWVFDSLYEALINIPSTYALKNILAE